MSGGKDSFEILADEITLIRREIEQLQRSSLNKDEAKALNNEVAKSLQQMTKVGPSVYEAISARLDLALDKMRREAVSAAQDAASGAIEKSHAESIVAAKHLSRAAGEARREAWRYFGGFWVWLTSIGAAGAVLGLLVAFWITGRGDAREFGKYPSIYCSTAGGQIQEQTDGSSFCAIWIKRPSQAGG